MFRRPSWYITVSWAFVKANAPKQCQKICFRSEHVSWKRLWLSGLSFSVTPKSLINVRYLIKRKLRCWPIALCFCRETIKKVAAHMRLVREISTSCVRFTWILVHEVIEFRFAVISRVFQFIEFVDQKFKLLR